MRKKQRQLFIVLGVFCASVALFSNSKLSVNQTKSLPEDYFFSIKGMPFNKGDLVLILGHKVRHVGTLPLIKRVVGIPGDPVSPLLGSLKTKTTSGKPLTPNKVEVIPEGYVFVRTEHENSFDSRYEEFGLVEIKKIYGRSFPLW